jgi:uncharacterized membrane protein
MKQSELKSDQRERFNRLVMAAIDGELGPDEKEEFEHYVRSYPECRDEWEQFKKVKEVTKQMKLQNPPDEIWHSYWLNVYNRIERGLGWIFLSIGTIIVLVFAAYQFLIGLFGDANLPVIVKAGILLLVAGVIVLLISVARERFFARKSDPYKEVQR